MDSVPFRSRQLYPPDTAESRRALHPKQSPDQGVPVSDVRWTYFNRWLQLQIRATLDLGLDLTGPAGRGRAVNDKG
jgi:hypothetical protein